MSSLQNLLDQRQLWRARDTGDASAQALSSGWLRLDRELYGAGWPIANLSELLCAEPVLAWQLLQPALVQLSQQQRLLIWIGQSSPPYAPAWLRAGLQLGRCLLVRAGEEEAPWAAEQALRLASGGAVILQSAKLTTDRLRRLQLAAQAGNSFAFLLRPLSAQRQSTPAALRMSVLPASSGLQIGLHKRRGGTASAPFLLPMSAQGPTAFGRLPDTEGAHPAAAGNGPALAAVSVAPRRLTLQVGLAGESGGSGFGSGSGKGLLASISAATASSADAHGLSSKGQRARFERRDESDGVFNAG